MKRASLAVLGIAVTLYTQFLDFLEVKVSENAIQVPDFPAFRGIRLQTFLIHGVISII
jgi:hypothetical protein